MPYTFEVLDTSIPVWRSTPEEEIDVVAQYGTQTRGHLQAVT